MGAGQTKGKNTGSRVEKTVGESREETTEVEAKEEPGVGIGVEARMEHKPTAASREDPWWRLDPGG